MPGNLKSWLKQLKRGDQSAFLPLYQKTSPGLMRYLLWKTKGDRPLSEDILQETYVRFLLAVDRLESTKEIAIQSYLLQIVRNCLIDKVARSPEARRPHVALDAIPDIPEPMQNRQEQAVELRELSVAMQSLSERESEIVWLRDGMGLSHREVADRVGITEQASRQAYVRAKRSLIAFMGDGFTKGGMHAPELS
ncbi:sigma-70 family RNA polymerase sigma factor [bacterium]|nr:sigma-70 family RNA polymerase sigma factor [bacterium]